MFFFSMAGGKSWDFGLATASFLLGWMLLFCDGVL